MKDIKLYGDNVSSYAEYAYKAAKAYKRATGKSVDKIEIRDRNNYVSFTCFRNGQDVALYGLENGRIVKGYVNGIAGVKNTVV